MYMYPQTKENVIIFQGHSKFQMFLMACTYIKVSCYNVLHAKLLSYNFNIFNNPHKIFGAYVVNPLSTSMS